MQLMCEVQLDVTINHDFSRMEGRSDEGRGRLESDARDQRGGR